MQPATIPVSWQSAFFGLCAIALNTMTQPAGSVCGFSVPSRLFVRCSPLVCLVDNVVIVVQILYTWTRSRSFRHAVRHTLELKFPSGDDGHEDSLASLRSTTVTRWTVAALGAAPQVVKIFAFRGLWATQTCAAMYVSSWIAIEILVYMSRFAQFDPTTPAYSLVAFDSSSGKPGRRNGRVDAPKSTSGSLFARWVGIGVAMIHCSILHTFVVIAGETSFLADDHKLSPIWHVVTAVMWLPWYGCISGILAAIIFSLGWHGLLVNLVWIFSVRLSTRLSSSSAVHVGSGCAFAAGLVYGCYNMADRDMFRNSEKLYSMAFLYSYLAIGVVLVVRPSYPFLWRFIFLWATCLITLWLFVTSYDPTGTQARPWTSYLG